MFYVASVSLVSLQILTHQIIQDDAMSIVVVIMDFQIERFKHKKFRDKHLQIYRLSKFISKIISKLLSNSQIENANIEINALNDRKSGNQLLAITSR